MQRRWPIHRLSTAYVLGLVRQVQEVPSSLSLRKVAKRTVSKLALRRAKGPSRSRALRSAKRVSKGGVGHKRASADAIADAL